MRIELAEVPASRQKVPSPKWSDGWIYWTLGMHSLSDNLIWWGSCTLHTQVTDASEWGVAYIPARV